MNYLEVFEHNGRAVVSSQNVAKAFSIQHNLMVTEICTLWVSDDFRRCNFTCLEFKKDGKMQIEYLLTRDSFLMLSMKYASKKTMSVIERYIAEFDKAEKSLYKSEFSDVKEALDSSIQKNLSLESENNELKKRFARPTHKNFVVRWTE